GAQEEVGGDEPGEDRALGHDQGDDSPPRRRAALIADGREGLGGGSGGGGDGGHQARSTSVRHAHQVRPTTAKAMPMTPTRTALIIRPTKNTPMPQARMNGRYVGWGRSSVASGRASSPVVSGVSW